MPWSDDLPEDVKTWDEVTNSETSEAFWKQVGDMRSHLGQSIRIPSAEAGDEDWKTFNSKLVEKVPTLIPRPNADDPESVALTLKALGHPEAADKYANPKVEKLDETRVEAFRAVAHKHGLTQKQFEGIVTDINTGDVAAAQEHETKHAQAMQTLRTDWGLAYDANMEKAKTLIKDTSGPDEVIKAIEEGRASSNTLIWLHNLSKQLGSESTNLNADKGKSGDPLTPGEARARLNEIMGDRKNPYWIKGHPSNADMIKKVVQLQGMANPEADKDFNALRIGGTPNNAGGLV